MFLRDSNLLNTYFLFEISRSLFFLFRAKGDLEQISQDPLFHVYCGKIQVEVFFVFVSCLERLQFMIDELLRPNRERNLHWQDLSASCQQSTRDGFVDVWSRLAPYWPSCWDGTSGGTNCGYHSRGRHLRVTCLDVKDRDARDAETT